MQGTVIYKGIEGVGHSPGSRFNARGVMASRSELLRYDAQQRALELERQIAELRETTRLHEVAMTIGAAVVSEQADEAQGIMRMIGSVVAHEGVRVDEELVGASA